MSPPVLITQLQPLLTFCHTSFIYPVFFFLFLVSSKYFLENSNTIDNAFWSLCIRGFMLTHLQIKTFSYKYNSFIATHKIYKNSLLSSSAKSIFRFPGSSQKHHFTVDLSNLDLIDAHMMHLGVFSPKCLYFQIVPLSLLGCPPKQTLW